MIFLIFMFIKLSLKAMWLMFAVTIWLAFALILIPVAIVQSCKGNQVGSRKTMRGLNFGHRFWDPL